MAEIRERYDQQLLDRHRPLLRVDPQYTGSTTLVVPESRRPTAIMASAFNALRQRSEVTAASL